MQGDGEINALFSGSKGAQTPPGGLDCKFSNENASNFARLNSAQAH